MILKKIEDYVLELSAGIKKEQPRYTVSYKLRMLEKIGLGLIV